MQLFPRRISEKRVPKKTENLEYSAEAGPRRKAFS